MVATIAKDDTCHDSNLKGRYNYTQLFDALKMVLGCYNSEDYSERPIGKPKK